MIGTEFLDGQGLGNQLFCYVTARAIAAERGCAFGTAGQERFANNIHSRRGMYFMMWIWGSVFHRRKQPP